MLGGIRGWGPPSKLTRINLKKKKKSDSSHPNKMKINKWNAGVRMSSCSDDRLTYGKLRPLAGSRREVGVGLSWWALITLFRGKEVLPCLSLYMLELHCCKHTHVREECSLLLSFGISYCSRKVIKATAGRGVFLLLLLFKFCIKIYYLMCNLCLSWCFPSDKVWLLHSSM